MIDQVQQQADMPLPEAIRYLRTELRLTVPEYARISGVAARTIYNIESGRANPSVNIANKLLKPFGLCLGISQCNRPNHTEHTD